MRNSIRVLPGTVSVLVLFLSFSMQTMGQGVTTAAISGTVTDDVGEPLPGANVVALHEPTGTQYGTVVRAGGVYDIENMRVGGPYTISVSFVGFDRATESFVYLSLAQDLNLNFILSTEAVELEAITVTAWEDETLNPDRTGAETFVSPEQVTQMPSVKRSTRDLTRLDPRSDGNLSFGGRNWLYNNISLDGSYFSNPFGLDAPEPGGQSDAQPVPFDAIEQVQVSVAPFDVREGGFTGAGINQVTKSGTNQFKASLYTFFRNESLVGNRIRGKDVVADPQLSFNQYGFTLSGPIVKNKLFFFVNGELTRREDPGSDFVASTGGPLDPGVSRVDQATMDNIRQRMISSYGYDPGAYQGYFHNTDNDKILAKLDWNINTDNNLSVRYSYLDAFREQGPHPFVLSFSGTGRGPNETSLPFQKSGYTINNNLHSVAVELNSRSESFANRFFASYNRFRDFRLPFSTDFPTLEVGDSGVTYTTIGHEPFSIHNILDQDVWQFTNNFSFYKNKHVITVGANFEYFKFFNSFNIFRHGLFGLPFAETTIFSLEQFFDVTDPNSPNYIDYTSLIASDTAPFKGEIIETAQLSFYAQDEFLVSDNFDVTFGLRVDVPMYMTDPVANPFSTGDADNPVTGQPNEWRGPDGETIELDQAKLAGATPLLSPRVGFNWDLRGDRSAQLRGGLGVFTGRVPFVWIGNVVSNPGANPELPPEGGAANDDDVVTREGGGADPTNQEDRTEQYSRLSQSFDMNAMADDFKWPQVFTANLALDKRLPGGFVGTIEVLYSKDLNSIYVYNADLNAPADRTLEDGRPYYGAATGENEINADFGAGAFVIDNSDEGYNYSVTGQLRKSWESGLNLNVAYTYLKAKSLMKNTEIASVLFNENPVQGNPNQPGLGYSEFGNRHRVIAAGTYAKTWNRTFTTKFGLFFEAAEGNKFLGAGGNRYSFTYSGDVNGDGAGGNDLIYIPERQDQINLQTFTDDAGGIYTAVQQWEALDAFIEQDAYLSQNRGKIAERFGGVNPWFWNVDLRILQDINLNAGGRTHTLQLSLDILNLPNLLSSSWGVRKVATSAATSPLALQGFDAQGEPIFTFPGAAIEDFSTYVDSPDVLSRWQLQLGIRYIFN